MRQKDLRPAPALIEYKGMKFLITDRPSDITINHYIMVSPPYHSASNSLLILPSLPPAGAEEEQCQHCGPRVRAQLQYRGARDTRH